MTSLKIPSTDDALTTHRVEPGEYAVHRVTADGEESEPCYKIRRPEYGGGWELLVPHEGDWMQVGGNRDTIQAVLRCATARAEHDRLWADYKARLAAWDSKEHTGIGRMFPPKPETHKIDAELGHLYGPEVKIIAGRLGKDEHLPIYRVFIDETEIGYVYLLADKWHIGGATDWYAGPNNDWTTFRHGGGDKQPERVAAHFARGAMRIVISRYMRHEISRRDEQVAEEKKRHG